MKFDLAIGKSRHDKKWVNKEYTWAEFTNKLKKTIRTHETLSEYLTFTKDRQDEIKDVGGFVSGKLANGRRLKDNVVSKQILTLDVDDANKAFWDLFTLQFECLACLYSTHKHQPDKPKFRLLIPLDREVMKEEYEAICRKVSELIGINYFDHTSFRPTQLMYWPSTSKDAEFVYKEQLGEPLEADYILGLYHDWTNIGEWPITDKEKKQKEHLAKHQGDPLEKPGLIGFFNNAYTIEEAMDTFIPDVYEKIADNRFTYKGGSTSGGVVTYNDKFIYSHHSSDPIGGLLCNAFDLIRLHKFGDLDDPEATETPVNKLQSYVSMCNLASKDDNVKRIIGEFKLKAAKESFKDVILLDSPESTDWLSKINVDRKGNYLNTINNIALILENDPLLINKIAYDEFMETPVWLSAPPWRSIKSVHKFIENDLANLENHIELTYSIPPGKLLKGLAILMEKTRFHPVISYIKSLYWDGEPRVDTLLIDYLGCEDSEYTRTITRKTLVAAVSRVFKPGIKFDSILVTVGEEGQGKSTIWDKLGKQWFNDTFSLNMLKSKEAYEQLQGSWIIEIAELSGMAKAEIEHVKSFVSSKKDKYRSAYARIIEDKLRQCIFVGSTNILDFLKSQTGNRRFWPALTNVIKPKLSPYKLDEDTIDQIWAEAYELYCAGESLFLDDVSILNEAILKQNEFTEEDPLVELIENFLSFKLPENWYNLSLFDKREFLNNYKDTEENLLQRQRVCKYEIWELVMNKKDTIDTWGLKQIRQAMRKIKGWKLDKTLIRFGNTYPRHRGSWVLNENEVVHFQK